MLTIKLVSPRGFCAGVDRAIDIVYRVLELYQNETIYVRHEVVHNKFVVSQLKDKGAIFIEDLADIPDGSTVIFSAHGVSKAIRAEAKERNLRVFDATCPLVSKVHVEVMQYSRKGCDCILIGHSGHPEVEGTMGQFDRSYGGEIYLIENIADVEKLIVKNSDNLRYVSQTTLSLDDTSEIVASLKLKYPKIEGPHKNDICYATTNRQQIVKRVAPECDLFLVIGSQTSSNSNRLCELAGRQGCEAYLIDGAQDMLQKWFDGINTVGITAGASAPEVLVQEVIAKISSFKQTTIEDISQIEENVIFNLPIGLRAKSKA